MSSLPCFQSWFLSSKTWADVFRDTDCRHDVLPATKYNSIGIPTCWHNWSWKILYIFLIKTVLSKPPWIVHVISLVSFFWTVCQGGQIRKQLRGKKQVWGNCGEGSSKGSQMKASLNSRCSASQSVSLLLVRKASHTKHWQN